MRLQTRNGTPPAGEFLPRIRLATVGTPGRVHGPGVFGDALAAKIGIGALVVALVAGSAAAAALLLWLVSVLVPVAVLAGLVAYTAFRIQFGARGRPSGFAREI